MTLEGYGAWVRDVGPGIDWWNLAGVDLGLPTDRVATSILRSGAHGDRLAGAFVQAALLDGSSPAFVEERIEEPGELGERLLGSWWASTLLDRPDELEHTFDRLARELDSKDLRRRRIACWAVAFLTTDGLERTLAHPIRILPRRGEDDSLPALLGESEAEVLARCRGLCESMDRGSLAERHRAFAVRSLSDEEAPKHLRMGVGAPSSLLWLAYLRRMDGFWFAAWAPPQVWEQLEVDSLRAADPATPAQLFLGSDLLRLHGFVVE